MSWFCFLCLPSESPHYPHSTLGNWLCFTSVEKGFYQADPPVCTVIILPFHVLIMKHVM